jgi:hypothetical protein
MTAITALQAQPETNFNNKEATAPSSLVMRTVVLLDLENLCGGSQHVPERAVSVTNRVLSLTTSQQPRQIVAAYGIAAHRAVPDLAFALRGARILIGRGIDGADLRLIEVLDEDPSIARSSHVVLGSGDGIFADKVSALGRSGTHVTVVGRQGAISRRLRLAAHESVAIETFKDTTRDVA